MNKEECLRYDFSKYKDVEKFANSEDLFWSDITLHLPTMDLIPRLYNANSGKWYEIESKYTYSSLGYLVENNYNVTFWLVNDKELIKDLEKECLS